MNVPGKMTVAVSLVPIVCVGFFPAAAESSAPPSGHVQAASWNASSR